MLTPIPQSVKDGFGKFQRGPLPVGEDLGVGTPFPYARDLEILQEGREGEETPRVVKVPRTTKSS